MTIFDIPVKTLDGEDSSLGATAPGAALLVVNVASQCGLTPQYTALEKLHEQFASRGLTVVGFPCNQFGGQEPGTAEEIAEFCSTSYGVTFPMFEKVEVNGPGRNAIYDVLTATPDTVNVVLMALDQIKAIVAGLAANGTEPAGDDSELIAALNAASRTVRGYGITE